MAKLTTTHQRSYNMSRIRSRNTTPERDIRSVLWHRGYRYRVNDKRLPGSPDIVLPKYRTAIFVHGCFWHGHKDCKNYTVPKTNTDLWVAKVARNRERDQEVWRQLEAQGWSVIIVWECELKTNSIDTTIARVEQELIDNRETFLRLKAERVLNRQQRLAERKEQRARHDMVLTEIKQITRNETNEK